MDQFAEENVRSRFNIGPNQQLADFHFRETRSDIQSSVILLSQRVKRQYMSEFVLPDDTRIAVRRVESSMPADHKQVVTVSLAVRHPFDSVLPQFVTTPTGEIDVWKSECGSTTTLETLGEATTDSGDEVTLEKLSEKGNLRILDYLDDDAWAATLLEWDSGANGELLRQLEAGCRLDPDSFRMERLQRRRNWKTVVDIQQEPQTRSLGFSRNGSESGSLNTSTTTLE
ncbi:hypothetical protein ECG_04277 [Echinococcus granulosus]|uniref:Uncharacterized protein n=1 Tax=Echinococcus granulosus TaxID=6210 RepID=U6J6V2_ECHGR|nr:hypothetical protein EGR_00738 [Echinococcus granulosus]EUB64194.1 hypothetical protein EGR_00738 [Echinococcus granulosus]KAH9283580.1 hypothetical protein ECG_04277 [Echinococcus granulosus]CDS17435.1 hypothetical protein EgrG_001018700 [Echinococcus granulosus]